MTVLDEVCEKIGFSATVTLLVWYAGCRVWVPSTAPADHPLATLLGLRTLRSLVEGFGGEQIDIPQCAEQDRLRRDRRIAEALAAGALPRAVADAEGLTTRRVEQLRAELELRGWLQYATARKRGHRPASTVGNF